MGMSLFGSSCSCNKENIKAKAPDKKNFTILKSYQVGKHVVVIVNYPNCSNYEGKKVLLYTNTTVEFVSMQKEIDPHFEKKKFSPFARFAPNNLGVAVAKRLAEYLNTITVK